MMAVSKVCRRSFGSFKVTWPAAIRQSAAIIARAALTEFPPMAFGEGFTDRAGML
jgi:hypothetical protein